MKLRALKRYAPNFQTKTLCFSTFLQTMYFKLIVFYILLYHRYLQRRKNLLQLKKYSLNTLKIRPNGHLLKATK